MASGGHLGFMQIIRVAQTCLSGNQARFVLEPMNITNQQKNFIVLDISRLMYRTYRGVKWTTIETFKILNEMAPPVLSNLVRLRDNSRYNFRYNNILQVPHVRTTMYGKNSFRYAAAVLWNSFPDEFRQVNNFSQFKSLLANWNGGDCRCNLCR